jgi:hypothetical protein
MTGIDWLRTLHTKQLLLIKSDCYQKFFWYKERIIINRYSNEITFTWEELKEVLSERPHILDGRECKQIRQIAAKKKLRIHQSVY